MAHPLLCREVVGHSGPTWRASFKEPKPTRPQANSQSQLLIMAKVLDTNDNNLVDSAQLVVSQLQIALMS